MRKVILTFLISVTAVYCFHDYAYALFPQLGREFAKTIVFGVTIPFCMILIPSRLTGADSAANPGPTTACSTEPSKNKPAD